MLETCADLGLGWYIGTVLLDCTDDIADLIPGTAQRLGVAERNIVFYDSSGGGFAALLALRWFPLACVCWHGREIQPRTACPFCSFR